MKDESFSIDASIVLNGRNTRGTLKLDTRKLQFVSNGSILLEEGVAWEQFEYSARKEKVRKFLLLSSVNYVFSFVVNETSLPRFVTDEKQGELLISAIDSIRASCAEQKKQEQLNDNVQNNHPVHKDVDSLKESGSLNDRDTAQQKRGEPAAQKSLHEITKEEIQSFYDEWKEDKTLKNQLLYPDTEKSGEAVNGKKTHSSKEEDIRQDALTEALAEFTQTIAAYLKRSGWQLIRVLDQYAKKRLEEEHRLEAERRRLREEERRREAERLEAKHQMKVLAKTRQRLLLCMKDPECRLVCVLNQCAMKGLEEQRRLVCVLDQYARKRLAEERRLINILDQYARKRLTE